MPVFNAIFALYRNWSTILEILSNTKLEFKNNLSTFVLWFPDIDIQVFRKKIVLFFKFFEYSYGLKSQAIFFYSKS